MADELPDGLVIANEAGRVVLFNRAAARMTSVAAEEALGKFVSDVLPFRDSDDRDWWVFVDPYHGLSTRTRHPERSLFLTDGIELLIGARWDPRFGPIALAGSGGLYAEILRDTAVRLAPVTESEAEAMLRALRIAPLLTGARGRPSLDLAAAAAALAALSRVAATHPELAELEINPLLVTRDQAIALDARFIPHDRPE